MPCKVSIDQISKHLSAAKDGRGGRLASHVAGCADCTEKIRLLQKTTDLITSVETEIPSIDIWQNIQPKLKTQPVFRKPVITGRRVAVGFVSLLLVLFLAFQISPPPQHADDIELFYERHSAVTPVAAQDELKRNELMDVQSEVDFAIRKPRNLTPDWILVRADKFTCRRGFPVTQLIYSSNGRNLSIFQKPHVGGMGYGRGRGGGRGMRIGSQHSGGPELRRFEGQDVAVAFGYGMRYVVVGDLPAGQLQAIAEDLASQF